MRNRIQSLVIDRLGRDTYVPTKPRHRYIALQFLLSMINEFARSLRSLANYCGHGVIIVDPGPIGQVKINSDLPSAMFGAAAVFQIS